MMIRRLIGAALMLAALAAFVGSEAQAQKKPKKDKPAATLDSATLPVGDYSGILKSVPGTDRMYNVEIEQKIPVYKNGGRGSPAARVNQLQNQINQAQAQALSARTVAQRNNALRRINSLMGQLQNAITAAGTPIRYDTKKYIVEFQNKETVQVRTMVLPEVFDDKGNLRKYTASEKLELKGKDKKAPGYESSLDKLEVGQQVTVKLVKMPKKKKPTPPKDSAKDGAKEAPPEDDTTTEKTKQVRRIIITKEADGSSAGSPGDKPKKK
jgi:hypothetical protein